MIYIVGCYSRRIKAKAFNTIGECKKFLADHPFLVSDSYCIYTKEEWNRGSYMDNIERKEL